MQNNKCLKTQTCCNLCSHEFVSGLVLQIGILSNHQNGRDTHVRQVKVFGPREDIAETFDSELSWTTAQGQMYATVR